MTASSMKGMGAPQGEGDWRAFGKTTTLHVHDDNVKMPHCTFGGGRKHATTNFSFPF